MNTLWVCNYCDDICSSQICKCSIKFICPICSVQNSEKYSNVSNQFLICDTCGYCKSTIIGIFPDLWEIEIDNRKIKLTFELDQTLDKNLQIPIEYKRKIVIELSVPLFENLINGTYFKDIKINEESNDNITFQEKCYFYALLISFFPLGPENFSLNRYMSYLTGITQFNNWVRNHREDADGIIINIELLLNVKKYIDIFIAPMIVRKISQMVLAIENSNNNPLNQILNESMEDSVPMYSASDKFLKSLKDKEVQFKSFESDKVNCSCTICLEEFESDDLVIQQPCCKNILHAKCLTTWLSDCNHVCPICRFEFEKDENTISHKLANSSSSTEIISDEIEDSNEDISDIDS